MLYYKRRKMYIQGVSEIVGQSLRAYSTHCKDEEKSYRAFEK